jgi:hypothetical protein
MSLGPQYETSKKDKELSEFVNSHQKEEIQMKNLSII